MDVLASQRSVGEEQTRLNVLRLKDRIFSENSLWAISCSKHTQDVLHCDSHVANDRFAAQYVRANRDAG